MYIVFGSKKKSEIWNYRYRSQAPASHPDDPGSKLTDTENCYSSSGRCRASKDFQPIWSRS